MITVECILRLSLRRSAKTIIDECRLAALLRKMRPHRNHLRSSLSLIGQILSHSIYVEKLT